MFLKRIFLLCALLTATSLQAGIITNVVISEVSSQFTSGADRRHATNLVNGTGLFGDVHTAIPQGSMWLSSPTTAGSVEQQFVTFDLGQIHNLSQIRVWNYNEAASGANILTRRGVQFADIAIAGEDFIFTTNKSNQLIRRATGTFTNFFDVIDMAGASARYVRINVRSNYLEAADYRVGLSKVLFVDNALAPAIKSARRSFSGDRVTVQFAEAMGPGATNSANYTISGGATAITVTNADYHVFKDAVVLRLSAPLKTNEVYTLTARNIPDAAGLSFITNAALQIDSDLMVWLKADDGITADPGGLVSEWRDQSGHLNNAVQVDPAAQPTKLDNAVTNKPAVHFDGATQFLEVPFNDSTVADRDLTLYLVLSFDLANTFQFQGPIGINNVNIPASFDLYLNRGNPINQTPRFTFLRGNGSANQSFQGQASPTTNQFYILSVVMRGTNATMYLNGNFNGSATLLPGLQTVANSIRLGLRQDNGTRFQGSIAETMIFNGSVSDAERANLDQYLGTKYGINVVALEFTRQPLGSTIEAGQNAFFTARAQSGSPIINYQWQSNSVNIAGATNTTYRTPFLTTPGNVTYRVVATTPLGVSLTSSNAAVTVTADTTLPTVSSVTRTTNSQQLLITFSEPVTIASATNLSRYALDNGATVTNVLMAAIGNQAVLETSGLTTNVHRFAAAGVIDLAGREMILSTNLVLPANLSLWLRADVGTFLDGSNLLRQWNDQGPNGNHAVQFNAANRPAVTAGSINSNPSVTFDGADDYLEAFSTPSLAITNDLSIYVVANFTDFATFRGILGKTAGNLPGPYDFYALNGTGQPRIYRGNGAAANATITATAGATSGLPHVITMVMQSTNVSHFLNGRPNGAGVLNTTIADAGTSLKIGNRDDLALPMKGEIAEILIFNSGLTANDRRGIDTYLGLKYFPFAITEQPVPVATTEGLTASFQVSASAGGAVFNYQWQRNETDIPGANQATYTTPILSQTNNNDRYRVLISALGMATVASDTATLSVAADQTAPTVVSVGRSIWNPSQLVVVFSENVLASLATQKANFTLNNGAIVTNAVMGPSSNTVILGTTGLTPGTAFELTVQNLKDLFNNTIVTAGTAVGVYPNSIALWLRADAGLTHDAGLISTWLDQSGNANNAVAVSPEIAPTVVTNLLNDAPAVNFNGTNQYLVIFNSPTISIVGDMTIYAVAQFRSFQGAAAVGLIGKTAGTAGNIPAPFDYYLTTAGLPNFLRGNGTQSGGAAGQTAPTLGAPHLLSVTMRGTQVNHYLDAQPNGAGAITAAIGDSFSDVGLGTRTDLATKMNGDLQEILVFSSALSDADRASLDQYLGTKYEILTTPLPKLVAIKTATDLQLSWPAESQGFALQANPNLSNSNGWTNVTSTVTTANGINTVSVPLGTGNQFFRLIHVANP